MEIFSYNILKMSVIFKNQTVESPKMRINKTFSRAHNSSIFETMTFLVEEK